MTKKEFIAKFYNGDWSDLDRTGMFDSIQAFISNTGGSSPEVEALLGEKFSSIECLSEYDDPDGYNDLSDDQRTIQQFLAVEYISRKLSGYENENWGGWIEDITIDFDPEYCPDLDSVANAIIEISKMDVFEEDIEEVQPSPAQMAENLLESFNKQVSEQESEIDPAVREILLIDFIDQYKNGIDNPTLGAGLSRNQE